MALVKCKECGSKISDTASQCPQCGCKNLLKKETKIKKKIFAISIVTIVILLITLGTLFIINKKRVATYKENYEEILDKILDSADRTEDCLILYRKVWYNTIFEEDDTETNEYTKDSNGKFNDDFNDSLSQLWVDKDYYSRINEIKEDSYVTIPELFKKLKNPPKEMKDAFEDLEELYDAYLSFTGMAINPSGSLTSFTEKYNELDGELAKLYKKAYRNIE